MVNVKYFKGVEKIFYMTTKNKLIDNLDEFLLFYF